MMNLLYVIFTIICVFLIITVLLQPGKSGGLGAAFGGGGNTVFGASGGTPVFRRMTTVAAVCFMALSLLLAWLSLDRSVVGSENVQKRGLDYSDFDLGELQAPEIPAKPAPAPSAPAMPAPAPAPVAAEPAPAPAPVAAEPAPAPAPIAPAVPAT